VAETVGRENGRIDVAVRWVSGRWTVLAVDVIKNGES